MESPHNCTAWGLYFLGGKLNWQTTEVTVIFFGTSLAQRDGEWCRYDLLCNSRIHRLNFLPTGICGHYRSVPAQLVLCVHFLSRGGFLNRCNASLSLRMQSRTSTLCFEHPFVNASSLFLYILQMDSAAGSRGQLSK